jgi:hypothetical protein
VGGEALNYSDSSHRDGCDNFLDEDMTFEGEGDIISHISSNVVHSNEFLGSQGKKSSNLNLINALRKKKVTFN